MKTSDNGTTDVRLRKVFDGFVVITAMVWAALVALGVAGPLGQRELSFVALMALAAAFIGWHRSGDA